MTVATVDLVEISAAVEQLELGVDAFEFHGSVCGLLCAVGPGAVDHWLSESGVSIRSDIDGREALLETLHGAEADVWRALNATDFDFDLVLPGDEAVLDARVAALAAWCHGFATGVGLGGYSDRRADAFEASPIDEILADFVEISRAALTDDDASDVDQAGFDLAAVTEHVRVAVQLAFELLQHPSGDEVELTGSATTH